MPVSKEEYWLMLMYQCIPKRHNEKFWIWLQIHTIFQDQVLHNLAIREILMFKCLKCC